MKDYKTALRGKFLKYEKRYAGRERLVALRLGIWNLQYALTSWRFSRHPHRSKALKIGLALSGGLGDYLVALNYVAHLERFLEGIPTRIELMTESKKRGLLQNLSGREVGNLSGRDHYFAYDLFLSLRRFPKVEWVDRKRIDRFPRLSELVTLYEDFERSRSSIFVPFHYNDSVANQHSVCENKIRFQQPDIGGRLGIGLDYIAPIPLPPDEDEVLRRLGLPEKFITINRGVDVTNLSPDNVKMWPLEYYNALIPMIKAKFPGVPIVQLGSSIERSPLMSGIDRNLVGETSLDDLKVILKRSFLHFDGEGGMVHLRHALKGGESIVFFGPTCREFYGYPENLNLRADLCSWCEWVHDDWNGVCLRSGGKAACMLALTPEDVMKEVNARW